jgi:uncharacterized protein YceK
MHRNGNCIVTLLALIILIWLICMGGCELVMKKTKEAQEDKPAPTQPVQPVEAPIKPKATK